MKRPAPTRPRPGLQDVIAEIWQRRKVEVIDRAGVLERAADALLKGSLNADLRRDAHREAHKLNGSLGAFGLVEASRLAGDIEEILHPGGNMEKEQAVRLSELVDALFQELTTTP